MKKWKRGLAVALTATMVMGSGLTVFAAGEDAGSETTPSTNNSGGATGSGSSEGHVDQEKTNVVLPTVGADNKDSTTFEYTMDPERLIQGTSGKKYEEGTVFPDKDSDTGVYFLTGEKTYENTSKALQVINKSSCDITLTVKAKATTAATDINLATSPTPASGDDDDPELYLGLKVGKGTPTVLSGTDATITKTIGGKVNNFEVTLENGNYVYKEKADATTWSAIEISATGAVSHKAIEATTTAPTIDVTWSWAKAAEGATVDTSDLIEYKSSYTMTRNQPVVANLGVDAQISSITWNGQALKLNTQYTYVDGNLTITAPLVNYWLDSNLTEAEVVVAFTGQDDPVTVKIEAASEN